MLKIKTLLPPQEGGIDHFYLNHYFSGHLKSESSKILPLLKQ